MGIVVLIISLLGSFASIAGLAVSIYVYRKEQVIQAEVEVVKTEVEELDRRDREA